MSNDKVFSFPAACVASMELELSDDAGSTVPSSVASTGASSSSAGNESSELEFPQPHMCEPELWPEPVPAPPPVELSHTAGPDSVGDARED